MKARGQALISLGVVVVLLGGGVLLDRVVGVRRSPGPAVSGATSGAWLCPHGGGAKDWTVTLEVANPGSIPTTIRVSPIGSGKRGVATTFTVAPGTTRAVPAAANGRAASSFVEYFGSWVGVGWVAHAGGGESGVSAEPCAPQGAASRWFAADGVTLEGQQTYLIVMNPYASPAIFDVTLFRKGFAPVRDGALARYPLAPHRSVAFHLNDVALGEASLGAEVDVSRGRVGVASLVVSDQGGIRSVIGASGDPSTQALLPAPGEVGQGSLAVTVPGSTQARFAASLLSGDAPQPAGNLTEQTQPTQTSQTYQLFGGGPSMVDLVASQGTVVAVRRVQGPSNDAGATGGIAVPSARWVVTPTAACAASMPAIAIANPGSTSVEVILHVLPDAGGAPPADVSLSVPSMRVVGAPQGFLAADPLGAVTVTAPANSVVVSGASTSCGRDGLAAFAVGAGIPILASR